MTKGEKLQVLYKDKILKHTSRGSKLINLIDAFVCAFHMSCMAIDAFL